MKKNQKPMIAPACKLKAALSRGLVNMSAWFSLVFLYYYFTTSFPSATHSRIFR